MKKLLVKLWVHGKPGIKLSSQKILQISESLIAQAKNIPEEFCRKPRSLQEVKRWKATEFRQFLLYSGVVTLSSVLPRKYYDNFKAFFISTLMLSNPNSDKFHLDYAHDLIIYFVKSFKVLYGIENMTHNVHNLLHVVDDVRNFGCLDNYSSFPFKNYLKTLKKLIRKPSTPLQQVVNRIFEQQNVNSTIVRDNIQIKSIFSSNVVRKQHCSGPLTINTSSPQYLECIFSNCVLKCSAPNNCCGLKNGIILLLENIVTFNL